MVAALERLDLREGADRDLRMLLDSLDEVTRHCCGQARAANDDVHVPRRPRQIDRCLTRRVAAADDDRLFSLAEARFDWRRAVIDARALETAQLRKRKLAILRASREDDRARPDGAADLQLETIRAEIADEFRRRPGDAHLGAELLRLREGASRQLLTGDAGGEAEIVFDLRAGPRLAAGGVRLQDEDVETFGRAVHGGGKARGAGADDHQVANRATVESGVQPQALGDLLVGRALQHPIVAADDDRYVEGPEPEAIEQPLHVRVLLDVEVRVRLSVAGEELADPQGRRGMARADHNRVAGDLFDQRHATAEEGAQEDVTELHVRPDQPAQHFRRDRQHLTDVAHSRAHEAAAPEKQVHLAGEFPRSVHGNGKLLAPVEELDNLQRTREHHVEVRRRAALLVEDLARLHLPAVAHVAKAPDLVRSQARKHLLPPYARRFGHGGLVRLV